MARVLAKSDRNEIYLQKLKNNMSLKPISVLLIFLFISILSFSQQPRYTFKSFVKVIDTNEFKIISSDNGFIRSYVATNIQVWDIDDDSTTYMMGSTDAVVCFEGYQKNKKKEGVFSAYLIDSADHSKRYKIYEQTYTNNKLNGQWRTYTLHGTLTNFGTYKDDSLNGITRHYWIDGKSIMDETEYFNGHQKHIDREFSKNGKVISEIPFLNDKIEGIGKKYYPDGTIQEVVEFRNGVFDGVRKYYHPNGQLWIEEIYKEGKDWTVVANYTQDGKKRDAGTLKDGNGSIIFYNEDGSVREITNYINGKEVKN